MVHSLHTTDAAAADINQLPVLLHGDEEIVRGDGAYASEGHREGYADVGVTLVTPRRAKRGQKLTPADEAYNHRCAHHRAWVEHPFHVVKHLWGFTKVRYRGLAKNTAHLTTLFALANLYTVRRRLAPATG
jgi:IS5 family transposase